MIVVVIAVAVAALVLRHLDQTPAHESLEAAAWVSPDTPAGDLDESVAANATRDPEGERDPVHNASVPDGPSTLIVYTGADEFGHLGLTAAMMTSNLVGAFGPSSISPESDYTSGDASTGDLIVITSTSTEHQFSNVLLDDIAASGSKVIWMGPGFDQLLRRHPDLAGSEHLAASTPVPESIVAVRYEDSDLPVHPIVGEYIGVIGSTGPAAAVIAEAVLDDGRTIPWAVRSPRFVVLADTPFRYHGENLSYMVLADQLLSLLRPDHTTRHRALVRLEDVGPTSSAADLRAVADELARRKIAFSVGVYPVWRDPNAVWDYGAEVRLADSPEIIDALEYMLLRGGTIVLHGYTHQRGSSPNPFDGVSGNDYEFFAAHIDENDHVIEDGPLHQAKIDATPARISEALEEFEAAGLERPRVFEFPHYAASAADYVTTSPMFEARFERPMYHLPAGAAPPEALFFNQWYPYPVVDSYGELVLPENLGNIEPQAINQHAAILPAELIDRARMHLVVDDNVAGFFYHPFLGAQMLGEVLDGMLALGYEFVDADTLIDEWNVED